MCERVSTSDHKCSLASDTEQSGCESLLLQPWFSHSSIPLFQLVSSFSLPSHATKPCLFNLPSCIMWPSFFLIHPLVIPSSLPSWQWWRFGPSGALRIPAGTAPSTPSWEQSASARHPWVARKRIIKLIYHKLTNKDKKKTDIYHTRWCIYPILSKLRKIIQISLKLKKEGEETGKVE